MTFAKIQASKQNLKNVWRVSSVLFFVVLTACSWQPGPVLSIPDNGLEPAANLWLSMTDNQPLVTQSNEAFYPSLTTRSDGTPHLAWKEAGNIYVKYWHSGSWYSYNNNQPLDINVANESSSPSVAGGGFVAWQETDSTSTKVYVKRWNSVTNTWVSLGAVNLSLTKSALMPSLAYYSSPVFHGDRIVVAWREEISLTNTNIYVKRWDWNTNTWIFYGPASALDVNTSNAATDPSLALDSAGNPVVAWNEWDGNSYNIYVKRWNGSSWTLVGTAVDKVLSARANVASLALDSADNPVVAWAEATATDTDVYVKRWNGSSWVNYGSGAALDKVVSNIAGDPSLKLTSSDNPIVSWREDESSGSNPTIYTKRWNGTDWVLLGSALDQQVLRPAYAPTLTLRNDTPMVAWAEQNSTNFDLFIKQFQTQAWTPYGTTLDVTASKWAKEPSLVLNSTDKPVVAWYESDFSNPASVYVKRWNGKTWLSYAGVVNTNPPFYPSLALDSMDRPFVALSESEGGGGTLYVKRWNGTAWVKLGTALETHSPTFQQPELELDHTDRPVVAWAKNASSYDLYVVRREGNAWIQLGGVIDRVLGNYANSYDLAIDASNRPVVVWQEWDTMQSNIYVKRWNNTTSTWQNLGNALDVTVARDAYSPSIAMGTDGNPVVAWTETINSSLSRAYVKRWNGTAWVAIGDFVNVGVASSIKVDSNNKPFVAFNQNDSSTNFQGNTYVKQWNGTAWVLMGKAIDRNGIETLANSAMLELTSTNTPVVAWTEQPYNNTNLYVSRY